MEIHNLAVDNKRPLGHRRTTVCKAHAAKMALVMMTSVDLMSGKKKTKMKTRKASDCRPTAKWLCDFVKDGEQQENV